MTQLLPSSLRANEGNSHFNIMDKFYKSQPVYGKVSAKRKQHVNLKGASGDSTCIPKHLFFHSDSAF